MTECNLTLSASSQFGPFTGCNKGWSIFVSGQNLRFIESGTIEIDHIAGIINGKLNILEGNVEEADILEVCNFVSVNSAFNISGLDSSGAGSLFLKTENARSQCKDIFVNVPKNIADKYPFGRLVFEKDGTFVVSLSENENTLYVSGSGSGNNILTKASTNFWIFLILGLVFLVFIGIVLILSLQKRKKWPFK